MKSPSPSTCISAALNQGEKSVRIFVGSSGWTIRPTFDQSSVSWYNRVRSLTTSRNRLNVTLPYVFQYPHILLYFRQFPKLSFNKLIDLS